MPSTGIETTVGQLANPVLLRLASCHGRELIPLQANSKKHAARGIAAMIDRKIEAGGNPTPNPATSA